MGSDPEHELSAHMIVVRFQQTFPLRIAEWLLAFVLTTWGAALLLNPTIFANGRIFVFMAQMAPQAQWGLWAFATGAVRLAALGINGAWRRSPHLRAATAFLSCFVWLQITFGLLCSNLPNVGLAIYPYFLLLDVYNVFRASSDARASDDRVRASS